MTTKTYIVTSRLVNAKTAIGADLYAYQGMHVPPGQSDEWIARHLADDAIAPVKVAK